MVRKGVISWAGLISYAVKSSDTERCVTLLSFAYSSGLIYKEGEWRCRSVLVYLGRQGTLKEKRYGDVPI